MAELTVKQKKWLKSIHVIAAGVWITTGAVMFLIHFLGNDLSTGGQLHLLNRIIHFIDMKLLVPAAITCLLSGWMYSQFTKWGYFKHGWLIFKWIITVLIIVLGTLFSGPWIEETVKISGELGLKALQNADYNWYANNHLIMGVCMTSTLIVAVFISVFKPKLKKQKL
ncbi:hypothetical protein [uncultured Draconibacterium sp.]|uniref:hypothetical protein n=1 Tax=uncultured Draconibacterium sp. TaxID=1573823 RepID=UPI0029C9397D|nr:hypothetical protein [uncultured Draconibacterium sp.]